MVQAVATHASERSAMAHHRAVQPVTPVLHGRTSAMEIPDPRLEPEAFLLALYEAAVARALPSRNMASYLPKPPSKGRTLVLGAGKAGGAMAEAVDRLWPRNAPLSGLVVTRYGHVPPGYRQRPGRI